jgi:hypothetical protein
MYGSVIVFSRHGLSEDTRDLAVGIASEEARKATGRYSFILHEALEGSSFVELIVEGRAAAITGLVTVLSDTLPYRVSARLQPRAAVRQAGSERRCRRDRA